MSDDRPWSITGASARGSDHVRRGIPNQDAFLIRPVGTDTAVTALADGHGGNGHERSDYGARFAVQIMTDVVSDSLRSCRGREHSELESALAGWLAQRVVPIWRSQVEQHLAENRPERRPAVLARELYGTTLLVAVMTPSGVVGGQIGDGDVAIMDRRNHTTDPLPADERLVAGATMSLGSPDAADSVRTWTRDDASLVLLATDGYGLSFASTDWRGDVTRDLQSAIAENGFAHVEQNLPHWVDESAEVAGDDVTVVIAASGGVSRYE